MWPCTLFVLLCRMKFNDCLNFYSIYCTLFCSEKKSFHSLDSPREPFRRLEAPGSPHLCIMW
jgi:hypothetical protein